MNKLNAKRNLLTIVATFTSGCCVISMWLSGWTLFKIKSLNILILAPPHQKKEREEKEKKILSQGPDLLDFFLRLIDCI